jgi:hypothetical protein
MRHADYGVSRNCVDCGGARKMRGFFPFGKLRVRMTILIWFIAIREMI